MLKLTDYYSEIHHNSQVCVDIFLHKCYTKKMKRIERILDTIDTNIDSRLPQSAEAVRRRRNRIVMPLATLAAAGVILGGSEIIQEIRETPAFSSETTGYITQEGDSLFTVVTHIQGIDTVDYRAAVDYVAGLPQNAAVLQDGLQPNELVTIPLSVESK